jgi:putative membrane protein
MISGAACSDDDTSTQDDATSQQSGAGRSSSTSKAATAGRGGGTASGGRGGATARAGNGGSISAAGGTNAQGPRATAGTLAAVGGAGVTGGTGGAGGSTNAANGGSTGELMTMRSDAQIAAALLAANDGEVQENMLAVTKAVTPTVRAYAQDLVAAHSATVARLNTVATAANITPSDSDITTQLRSTSTRTRAKLQAASTSDFDMIYLQSQIDAHLDALKLIDEQLLPDAVATSLRAEIVTERADVAMHLLRARALAETLNLDVDAGLFDVDAGI